MKESLIIAHKEDFIIISKDTQRHVPSPVGTEKLTNLPCLLYLMNNRMLNIQMSDQLFVFSHVGRDELWLILNSEEDKGQNLWDFLGGRTHHAQNPEA